jgi:hypothetical protein
LTPATLGFCKSAISTTTNAAFLFSTERRNKERAEIQKLAKTDLRSYYEAMKDWGLNREKRFSEEGWRKMRAYN